MLHTDTHTQRARIVLVDWPQSQVCRPCRQLFLAEKSFCIGRKNIHSKAGTMPKPKAKSNGYWPFASHTTPTLTHPHTHTLTDSFKFCLFSKILITSLSLTLSWAAAVVTLGPCWLPLCCLLCFVQHAIGIFMAPLTCQPHHPPSICNLTTADWCHTRKLKWRIKKR